MIGRSSARSAATSVTARTTRLMAPTTTGLRSLNGFMSGSPRRCSEERSGGEERRGVTSSQITPVGAGVVLHRDRDVAGQVHAPLELAEVEVEERAVDRGASDLVQLDRQHLDGAVELGLVLVDVAGHRAQLLDVLHEGLADAVDEGGGLDRQRGDLLQRAEDRVAVLLQPADERAERLDQPGELLVAVGDVVEHQRQVVDEVADDLVAVGERRGDRRRVREQTLQRSALPLEHLDELVRQLVDVVGRERLEERLEAVEEHREVERGRGPRHRDRRAGRQPPGVPHLLGEREVALPDEVAVADGGVGAAVDRGVAVDREGDQRTGPVDDLHLADRADPDAGDADVVALVDARGVGELRLALPRRPEVEVADGHHQHRGRERGDDDEDEQLDEVDRGPEVEDPAHRSDTSAPRAIGPTSRTPRSGTSSVLTPRPGASSDLSSADSSRPPAKPAAVPDQPGPTRLVPLPVGSSTPSTKSGWEVSGLLWDHGGDGSVPQW